MQIRCCLFVPWEAVGETNQKVISNLKFSCLIQQNHPFIIQISNKNSGFVNLFGKLCLFSLLSRLNRLVYFTAKKWLQLAWKCLYRHYAHGIHQPQCALIGSKLWKLLLLLRSDRHQSCWVGRLVTLSKCVIICQYTIIMWDYIYTHTVSAAL